MQISNFIEERVASLSGALLGRAGEPAVLAPHKNAREYHVALIGLRYTYEHQYQIRKHVRSFHANRFSLLQSGALFFIYRFILGLKNQVSCTS